MVKMKKAAYFADVTRPDLADDVNFSIIGDNTGNDAFIYAISNLIDVDRLPRFLVGKNAEKLLEYDTFITSDLIWIRQGVDAPTTIKNLLDNHPSKKIVAISMGLQSSGYNSEFSLSSDMIRTLERLSERSVMAVRGNYTAEILLKNNISNIEVIGCPSIYQYPLFQESFDCLFNKKIVKAATSNFRTFYEPLNPKEVEIISYLSCNFQSFVEQTKIQFKDLKPFSGPEYSKAAEWINGNEEVFFDFERWVQYCSKYDFSMGSRFHGNVAAIMAGIRSLLIVSDTRTRELSEFFSLPTIEAQDFNSNLTVQDYHELADFGKFQADYHNKISRFRLFLSKNELNFSPRFTARLEKFKFNRIGRPWLS